MSEVYRHYVIAQNKHLLQTSPNHYDVTKHSRDVMMDVDRHRRSEENARRKSPHVKGSIWNPAFELESPKKDKSIRHDDVRRTIHDVSDGVDTSVDEASSSHGTSRSNSPEEDPSGRFSCKMCRKTYVTSHGLEVHAQRCHVMLGCRVYECEICQKNFGHAVSLAQHRG